MATRYNYTGNIVTQGLVLNLDAAKTDSYPGTGTTWRDLSGFGNNGTLTNGPTFSGVGKQAAIVFDGVNDYIDISSLQYPTYNNNFTFNVWVNYTGLSTGYYGVGGWGDSGRAPYYEWGLGINDSKFRTQIFNGGLFYIDSSIIESNKWYNACFVVYQTGLMELYINLVKTSLTGTNNLIQSRLSNDLYNRTRLGIGANDSFGNMKGSIATTQIYNRALTAPEVQQNFNALRGRYGI